MSIMLIRNLMKSLADLFSMGAFTRPADEFALGPNVFWDKYAADGWIMSVEQMMRGMSFGIEDMDLHVVNDGQGDDCGIMVVQTKSNHLGLSLRIEVEPEKIIVGAKDFVDISLTHKPIGKVTVVDHLDLVNPTAEWVSFTGLTTDEVYYFYNRFVRYNEDWETIARELGVY